MMLPLLLHVPGTAKFMVVYVIRGKKVKERLAVNGNHISQLWDVTCHIGSQCYLPPDTSERVPSNLSQQAGTHQDDDEDNNDDATLLNFV